MKVYPDPMTIHPVFRRDPESGVFTVTVPELPGCVSEGRTLDEARAGIVEAAELWVEAAGERTGIVPADVVVEEVTVSSVHAQEAAT